MFAGHPDRSHSSFNLPSAKSLSGRVLGFIGRSHETRRAELLTKRQNFESTRGSHGAVKPMSQSLSTNVLRRRAFAGRSVITQDELRAQEWLDDRLLAFYQSGHGFWPRLIRFFRAPNAAR